MKRRLLGETWPISVCFAGYMLWWALGVSAFVWSIILVPVVISILSRGRIRIPRAMLLWFLFLGCVALSGVELTSGTRILTFIWRWSLYASAGALFVFVYNLPGSPGLDRRVLHGLTGLWMGLVLGGYLGIVLHGHTFTTPIEHLLPSHLRNNSFVQELVQPVFAQTQSFLGFPVPRPAAPFAYTNLWGGTIAVLMPIVFAEVSLARRGSTWRTLLIGLLAASVIPMVVSLDRGMFISLVIAVVYVSIRLAARGQRRSLTTLFGLALVGVVIVVATPLGHLVTSSFSSSHGNSNTTRLSVSRQAIDGANESPWLGWGSPQQATPGPGAGSGPASTSSSTAGSTPIGTQGQLWTVLYTNGYPATVFFLGFFLWALWQTRRARDTAGVWLHAVPLIALAQIFVYGWLPTEIQVVLVACALAYRRSAVPKVQATRPGLAAAVSLPSLTVVPVWGRERLPVSLLRKGGATSLLRRGIGSESLSGNPGRVARGSAINILTMTGGYLLTFTLTVLVSRMLGPRNSGVFFELVAMFMILSTTLTLGSDTGLTRSIAHAREMGRLADVRRIIFVAVAPVLILGAVAGGVIWFAAPQVAHLFLHHYRPRTVEREVRFVAVFIPLGALSTALVAASRGFGRMWPYLAVEGVTKPVLRITGVAAALFAGAGVFGAVVGWSVPVCIGALMAASIVAAMAHAERANSPANVPVTSWRRVTAEFWRFTSARGIAGMFQVAVTWLDILLVGAILSTSSSGIYAAVSRLAILGTFSLEGTRLAIGPHLSALMARKDMRGVAELYQTATRWLLLVSWPVYTIFAIFPGTVLSIFGPHFHTGASSLLILSLAMLVNIATGNVSVVLLMGGRSSWNVINTVAALAVNIGLNLYLLPRIGIAGAAIAWSASIILDNVAAVLEVWFIFRLSPFGRSYWTTCVAAAGTFCIVGLCVRGVWGSTRISAVVAVIAGLVAYAAVVYGLRDRLQVSALLGEIRRRSPRVGSTTSSQSLIPAGVGGSMMAERIAPVSTAATPREGQ